MKNRILFIGLLSYIGLFTACGGGGSDSSSQRVDRNEALVQEFNSRGTNKRIYVEIRDFNATISDEKIQEWKEQIADYAEHSWKKYEEYGFKSPATASEEGREVLKIFLEQGVGNYSGSARKGDEWLRLAGPPLTNGNLLDIEATISHEMFHSVQFKYNLDRYSNTLAEGTATLMPELLSTPLHERLSTSESCDTIYLRNPNGNMWFRPAGSPKHNVCSSSLWWRYLTQQLSTMNSTQNEFGVDVLKEMFLHLESPKGWRQREIDKFMFSNDFNGDGVDEILVKSDTHIGVTSPVLYNATSVDIVPNDGRFGDEWKYQESDKVLASCDVVGTKGSAFLIQSETHLGLIGMEDNKFKTLGVLPYNSRIGEGGWLLQDTDKILSTKEDGTCEFLIKSNSHLGLITYRNGAFKTLTSQLLDTFIDNGWKLQSSDKLVAKGYFNNDSQIDFVLKSDTHIGVISYDAQRQHFVVLGVMSFTDAVDSTKYFAGRIKNSEAERLIISSPTGLNIFGLGSNANLEKISTISSTQIGNTFGNQLTLANFIALSDLDGNGEKELLVRYDDGTLIAEKLNLNDHLTRLATASITEELNDTLHGAQYRTKWTPSTSYEVLLSADLDGDGKDELFIRDNARTFVLGLNDSNNFTVNTAVINNNRYDSLIKRTDNFIKSKTSQARDLHSMFNDFAVANYLNVLDGVTESKYKYAQREAIDIDHNSNTPPVRFRLRKNVTAHETLELIKQEPWSVNYFEFSSSSTAIGLASEMKHNISNVKYTFLVVKGNRLIRKADGDGVSFLRTIVLEEGEKVVLIITSFDAPLEYNIDVS